MPDFEDPKELRTQRVALISSDADISFSVYANARFQKILSKSTTTVKETETGRWIDYSYFDNTKPVSKIFYSP